MKTKTYIYILKTPLLLGVFIFLLSACENDIQEVRELTAKQDSAIYSGFDVEIKYSTNGITNGLMKAKVVNRFIESNNETYLEFPEGMHMSFFNKEGAVTSTLKANYSIFYEDKGKWIAKYDVEVVNENKEKLNTEYLIWLREEQKITSDRPVKITTAEGVFYGENGFVSDQEFTEWEIININDSFFDFETDK